jgi:hypothetical protein
MKKTLLSLTLMLLGFHFSYAQWTTGVSPTTITNTVGIGTTAPGYPFHIYNTTTRSTNSGSYADFGIESFNNTGWQGSRLYFGRARGTVTAPLAVLNGDYIGWLDFYGHDGTTVQRSGQLVLIANGAPSSGIVPGAFLFNLAGADGVNSERMRISSNGNVGIGTSTPNDMLDVNGFSIFGASVEKISVGSGSLGFNRKVATGAIYDNTKFGYQFQHTGSTTAGSDYLALQVYNPGAAGINPTSLVINGLSQVGVNTSYIPTGYQFAVNGSAIATSITVQLRSTWPDYVFTKNYALPSLTEVETYIDQNHHLPEIPSEHEVTQNGLNLGEMNRLLLKKVEELTLYLIESQKQAQLQQQQINELKEQMKLLRK